MTIDFGSIENYDSGRGFGFVNRTFFNSSRKVFFHIGEVKRKDPGLAQKLDSKEAFATVNFWYDVEATRKGDQVRELWLNADSIPQSYSDELSRLSQKVEDIWKDLSSSKPSWLDLVTIELFGSDRRHELSVGRDDLESRLRTTEEERRKDIEAQRENEIARMAKAYGLTELQAIEFHQLITEMRPLQFKRSKFLSKYIVIHKLGYKYPNISGIVRMADDGEEWDFPGGFPPGIYEKICRELNLGNEGTTARPIGFTAFKDIDRANQQ